MNQSTKAWGSEKHTELAGFSRNADGVFVTGDTAAAVTLRLISRQPAMSPTGFSDSHRDGSGWVAAFDNCAWFFFRGLESAGLLQGGRTGSDWQVAGAGSGGRADCFLGGCFRRAGSGHLPELVEEMKDAGGD